MAAQGANGTGTLLKNIVAYDNMFIVDTAHFNCGNFSTTTSVFFQYKCFVCFAAGSIVIGIPVIVLYFMPSKFLVSGLSTSAVRE